MLKATVNNQTFDIQEDKSELMVNNQPFHWDMVEIRDGIFSILYKNRSFNAEVLEADYQTKSFLIKINKNQYRFIFFYYNTWRTNTNITYRYNWALSSLPVS